MLLVTGVDCGVPVAVTGMLVVEEIVGILAVLSAVGETDVLRMCVATIVVLVADG